MLTWQRLVEDNIVGGPMTKQEMWELVTMIQLRLSSHSRVPLRWPPKAVAQ